MATVNDMATRIGNELSRTDLSSRIVEAIQSAVRHYERQRFYFNENTSVFNLSASQAAYTLADMSLTGVVRLDMIRVTVNGTTYPMKAVGYKELREKVTSQNYVGYPREYAFYQEMLYVYPLPTATFTAEVSWVKRLPGISFSASNSVSNAWTNEAFDLIRERAMAQVKINNLQQAAAKQEMAGLAASGEPFLSMMERQVYENLMMETGDKASGGGYIRPYAI